MTEQTGGPAPEKVDRYARQRAEAAAAQTADFDRWRASRDTRSRIGITIGGREYRLPKQPPLMFTLERQRLQGELTEDDVRRLVGLLYGENALDEFAEAGLDHDDLGVLLLWGGANCGAETERVTLDEAYAEYERMEREAAEGKAPNRATRRAAAKRKPGSRSSASGR